MVRPKKHRHQNVPLFAVDPLPPWAIEKCTRMVEIALWKGNKARAIAAIEAIFKETGRNTILYESPVAMLEIPQRVMRILEREQIATVGALSKCSKRDVSGWWMAGPAIADLLEKAMINAGWSLRKEIRSVRPDKPLE